MRRVRSALLCLGLVHLLVVLGCGPRQEEPQEPRETPPAAPPAASESPAAETGSAPAPGASATAVLKGAEGSPIAGTVTFTETADGVEVSAHLSGIPGDGTRGFHLHEVGNCTAPDFSSAGPHFNPAGAPHGGPDSAQHHAGDLGNVPVGADGTVHLEHTFAGLTVAPGPNSVVGRAVVLHEKADDFTTQPTGNAGGRVACGVVLADQPAGGGEGQAEDESAPEEPKPVS